MFDVRFAVESMRRHWKGLVAVLVVSLACGVAFSYLQNMSAQESVSYVAEVTFYVDGHDSDAVNEYNYELNEDYLASDVRRIIVSNKVSGEVRAEFGDDVSINTPYWVNRETESNIYSHYIYAEVSAPSEEIALAAARAVAEKALVQIEEQLPVTTVELVEGPLLKTVSGSAANYGVDDLAPSEDDFKSIDVRTVIAFSVCAVLAAIVVFLLHDFFVKRVRSCHDVERLFGIPVLGQVSVDELDRAESFVDSAVALASHCGRNGIVEVALCSIDKGTPIGKVAEGISANIASPRLAAMVDLSGSSRSVLDLASVPCIVLAVQRNEGASNDLVKAVHLLQRIDVPVLGAIYIG